MKVFDFFQIAILIVIGVIVSITDLRKGKIRNRTLFVALVIGLINNFFIYNGEVYTLKSYFYNMVLMCLISIILYFLQIWAGGDSKFLILIALLYPADLCWEFNGLKITLWIMLVFTFVIGYIYLLIDTVRCFLKKKQRFNITYLRLKEAFINYFAAIVFLAACSHICMCFVFPHFKLGNLIYTCICVCYIWWISAKGILKNKKICFGVLLFDIFMTAKTGYIPVNTEWKVYIIVIISMIIKVIIEKYNYEEIETKDVKEGMILSQISTLWFQQSKIKGLPQISDETLRSRITNEEVESVIEWGMSKGGRDKIVIVRKIPFAIFITLGMVIYVLCGGILKCY